MKKTKKLLGFVKRIQEDHVSAYAALAAYFLIMAFIPFALFAITFLRYTPVPYNTIREIVQAVFPQNLQNFVLQVVADIYRRSAALFPITIIAALWSSGKGLQAIISGLNTIYRVKETRNWLINRLYSILYIILFSIALAITLILRVLGKMIQEIAQAQSVFLGKMAEKLLNSNVLLVFLLLVGVFLVLYKFLPNRKSRFRSQVPGACFTAVSWILFSFLFSFYFDLFPNFSNVYGNMAAFFLIMLWLHICMLLMLCGAEINSYFEKEWVSARDSVYENIRRKREIKKAGKQKVEKQKGKEEQKS